MIIRNITDAKAPKVTGVGKYWIMPGEEGYIPDEICYVEAKDAYGRPTGEKVILPALAVQARMNLIQIVEEKEDKPAKPAEVSVEEAAEEQAEPAPAKRGGRKKKEE